MTGSKHSSPSWQTWLLRVYSESDLLSTGLTAAEYKKSDTLSHLFAVIKIELVMRLDPNAGRQAGRQVNR